MSEYFLKFDPYNFDTEEDYIKYSYSEEQQMNRYIKKAINIIKKGEFDSQWYNLFENGEKRALDVIKGLHLEAQLNEDFKYLLIRNKNNMPSMLIDMIGV